MSETDSVIRMAVIAHGNKELREIESIDCATWTARPVLSEREEAYQAIDGTVYIVKSKNNV